MTFFHEIILEFNLAGCRSVGKREQGEYAPPSSYGKRKVERGERDGKREGEIENRERDRQTDEKQRDRQTNRRRDIE